MWRAHPEYIALGQTSQSRQSAYRKLFTNHLSNEQITEIRNTINTVWYWATIGFEQKLSI